MYSEEVLREEDILCYPLRALLELHWRAAFTRELIGFQAAVKSAGTILPYAAKEL